MDKARFGLSKAFLGGDEVFRERRTLSLSREKDRPQDLVNLDHNFFVANAWITTSSSALIPQAIHLSFSLKVIH
jgi:hypothetical protein